MFWVLLGWGGACTPDSGEEGEAQSHILTFLCVCWGEGRLGCVSPPKQEPEFMQLLGWGGWRPGLRGAWERTGWDFS
jgi:hypothetical protein